MTEKEGGAKVTLRSLVEAVAGRLTELWPDRRVYVDAIPSGADGGFFVGVVESSQERRLGRRIRREVQFQILYFLNAQDNLAFLDWAEAMYDGFERLAVWDGDEKRTVRLRGRKAREGTDQGVYQFLFGADLSLLLAPEEGETMGHLEQKGEIGS